MERNNKTLLIAVLIMLLALVSLNFNNISGKVTNDQVQVTVSPTSVGAPGCVNVFVDAGKTVECTANLYLDGTRAFGLTDRICSGRINYGVFRGEFCLDSRVEPGTSYAIGVNTRDGDVVLSNTFSVY